MVGIIAWLLLSLLHIAYVLISCLTKYFSASKVVFQRTCTDNKYLVGGLKTTLRC